MGLRDGRPNRGNRPSGNQEIESPAKRKFPRDCKTGNPRGNRETGDPGKNLFGWEFQRIGGSFIRLDGSFIQLSGSFIHRFLFRDFFRLSMAEKRLIGREINAGRYGMAGFPRGKLGSVVRCT